MPFGNNCFCFMSVFPHQVLCRHHHQCQRHQVYQRRQGNEVNNDDLTYFSITYLFLILLFVYYYCFFFTFCLLA